MCFERTDKKVEPFHIGWKVLKKVDGKYYSAFSTGTMSSGWRGTYQPLPPGEWLDEMAWRNERLLLVQSPKTPGGYSGVLVGWHVFSTMGQAIEFIEYFPYIKSFPHPIVRVECYGLDKPCGLGLAFGKPAGRFQFMKILEEVT